MSGRIFNWPGGEDYDDMDDDSEFDGTEDLPGVTKVNVTGSFTADALRAMSVEDLMPHFKDIRGCWRTANLFLETCEDPAKYPPIYTLKDSDTSSQLSLRKLYLLFEDVTEYKFALYTLGGWEHWQAITDSWRCKPWVEEWRKLLDIQLREKYITNIKNIAESMDGPISLQANKYLLETTTGAKVAQRGRPSKIEKEAALKKELRDSDEIGEDMKRLGLKVIK